MYKVEHFTDTIYYQIELTAKYCKNLGVQIFSKSDFPITLDEFCALDVIMLHDGICQRELAKLILKDRANTGRILNTLEEKGWIKRFVDTKNNRLVRKMELTNEGKDILKKATIEARKQLNQVTNIISEEEAIFLKNIMKKFREGLKNEVEMKI
jgi:DNA-binding MarR family transcriptional regulator